MSSAEKEVSLLSIIKSVVEEYESCIDKDSFEDEDSEDSSEDEDSLIRKLQRKFNKLIEKLNCDLNLLKTSEGRFKFNEAEVPAIKVILSQIINKKGIISDFVNNKDKDFSVDKVHDLIQELIDEAEKSGMDEDELIYTATFLCSIFSVSPLRSKENCHRLIDALAQKMQDLTSTQQAVYFNKIELLLRKEFSFRLLELAIQTKEIAEIIEFSKELAEDDIGCQNYNVYDPAIMYEYVNRDREALKNIQKDDALRQYIETTIGKKAEDIFNYAASEI